MSIMAKSRPNKPHLYLAGTLFAFFLVWCLWSYAAHNLCPDPVLVVSFDSDSGAQSCVSGFNLGHDPPNATYFDDTDFSYSIDKSVTGWDGKRQAWLNRHPPFAAGARDRVVVVTGSQPEACKNPIGDHLLLRCFKNKVDYCRIHGYDIFYSNLLLHPKMTSYWAKLPVMKAAMLAHPEAEWVWWVDSDAVFTDMEFKIPFKRYDHKNHNLVVNGYAKEIYERKSWVGLNAGVFLMRNCQWSLDFMERWANMGPIGKDYAKWGRIQRSVFKDKLFPESDDQSALAYMLYEDERLLQKVYLEEEYSLSAYWLGTVPTYENITEKYKNIERRDARLRRRYAEKVSEQYRAIREPYLKEEGGLRRPVVTHFTGCQPCSGSHNPTYAGDACWNGMVKALNFADNQVLRRYGFVHSDLLDSNPVMETPFNYPEEGPW